MTSCNCKEKCCSKKALTYDDLAILIKIPIILVISSLMSLFVLTLVLSIEGFEDQWTNFFETSHISPIPFFIAVGIAMIPAVGIGYILGINEQMELKK